MKIACSAKSVGVRASTTILSSSCSAAYKEYLALDEGTGGTGGGDKEGVYGTPCPRSLPMSELWNAELEWECCDLAYIWPFIREGTLVLESPEAGVEGRNCVGLVCIDGLPGT